MTLPGKVRVARLSAWIAALLVFACIAWVALRSADLQFEIGYAYEHGALPGVSRGLARDYSKAAYWLRQAAQANHPRAQYRLGMLYAHGWGVPRDEVHALQWFTRAAQNAYAAAQYHLGWMYLKGDGVVRNDPQALHWFEQAAAQGMVAAHLALGRYYEQGYYEYGEGAPTNTVEALKRYELAVYFAHIRPELFDNAAFTGRAQTARDALAARLPLPLIQQAQALAKAWLVRQQAKTPP